MRLFYQPVLLAYTFCILFSCSLPPTGLLITAYVESTGEGPLSERDPAVPPWPSLALPHWGQSEKRAKPGQVPGLWLHWASTFTLIKGRRQTDVMLWKPTRWWWWFQELTSQPGDPKWVDIIERDLHRQFPFHEMFAARGGHGWALPS